MQFILSCINGHVSSLFGGKFLSRPYNFRLNSHKQCELSALSFEYKRPHETFETISDRLYNEANEFLIFRITVHNMNIKVLFLYLQDPIAGVIDPDLVGLTDECVVTLCRPDEVDLEKLMNFIHRYIPASTILT